MNLSKFLEVILAGALTMFIGLYFSLSSRIEEMNMISLYITKSVERHELDIQKIKVEMLTIERSLALRINDLRVECRDWMKRTDQKIDSRFNRR